MYTSIPHVCGGRAHLVGEKLVLGWNQYVCNRCGEVFFRWITEKMIDQEHDVAT
ncbi:MAG: hypothetical protein N3A57_01830 [Negativicutes bacterium]|nr:hypothetical protein [Negativicutes bacterium]